MTCINISIIFKLKISTLAHTPTPKWDIQCVRIHPLFRPRGQKERVEGGEMQIYVEKQRREDEETRMGGRERRGERARTRAKKD